MRHLGPFPGVVYCCAECEFPIPSVFAVRVRAAERHAGQRIACARRHRRCTAGRAGAPPPLAGGARRPVLKFARGTSSPPAERAGRFDAAMQFARPSCFCSERPGGRGCCSAQTARTRPGGRLHRILPTTHIAAVLSAVAMRRSLRPCCDATHGSATAPQSGDGRRALCDAVPGRWRRQAPKCTLELQLMCDFHVGPLRLASARAGNRYWRHYALWRPAANWI